MLNWKHWECECGIIKVDRMFFETKITIRILLLCFRLDTLLKLRCLLYICWGKPNLSQQELRNCLSIPYCSLLCGDNCIISSSRTRLIMACQKCVSRMSIWSAGTITFYGFIRDNTVGAEQTLRPTIQRGHNRQNLFPWFLSFLDSTYGCQRPRSWGPIKMNHSPDL